MYQSPLRLAGLTGDMPDPKALQLARKKLLAELELSGQSSIEWQGSTLSRQSINALFDELTDEGSMQLHLAIYRQKPLLQFLETANPDQGGLGNIENVSAIAPGRFSAIAGAAVQALLQKILKGEAPAAHYRLVAGLLEAVMPADKDAAFQPAYRSFTARHRSLEEGIRDEKERKPASAIGTVEWFDAERIALLNSLPDSFGDLRYNIGSGLNNLAVALDKNKKHRAALAIIKKANNIELPSSLKALVVDNMAIFRRNSWGYFGRLSWLQKIYACGIAFFVLLGFFSKIHDLIYPEAKPPDTASAAGPTYTMDENQRYNSVVFSALKTALAGWPSMDTPKIPPVILPVIGPCDTCGDPLAAVWDALFKTTGPALGDTGGASRIVIVNKLPAMNAIALINIDNRHFNSLYLRPGQAKTYFYKGINEAGFSFYIGSNWSSNALHEILIPNMPDVPDKTYLIRGAFTKVPHWQEYLSGQSDLLSRNNIYGKPYIDTVTLVPGKDGRVEFNLGLDERDL